MDKIVTAYDFKSPCCNEEFDSDELMQLGSEPFNGIVVECPSCGKEYSCDMLIKIRSS